MDTNKVDDTINEDIVRLWKSGKKSIMAIAVELNVGIMKVTNTLTENGLWGSKKKTKN